ncbi:MAG: thiamine phosphate synthase, partial [Pseudomonadota bacterium]
MTEPKPQSCRLYLITPPLIADLARFVENLKAALSGGDVACLQLRLKSPEGIPASDDEILRAAEAVLKI